MEQGNKQEVVKSKLTVLGSCIAVRIPMRFVDKFHIQRGMEVTWEVDEHQRALGFYLPPKELPQAPPEEPEGDWAAV